LIGPTHRSRLRRGAVPAPDLRLDAHAVGNEEVKGAKALGTPVIQPFRRGQPRRECGGSRQIGSDEAMTRQRRLKRRIRTRMARTGESYSTARRQVLRRLGNGAPVADQPEASEARRWHRTRIGAVGLVLAVAVAAVVVISSGDGEEPNQPSAEQQASPADELPPGLQELLVRKGRDLDRVRSVKCGAGRLAPEDLRSIFVRLIQESTTRSRYTERARELARDVANICRTEFRGRVITVSAKIGDRWLEIAPRAQGWPGPYSARRVAVAAVDQTPITVTELSGETHPGVMNNAIVVPCGDGKVTAVPEANPTSEAAKRDAQQVARESCKNYRSTLGQ
jgi:hypothetical protein